MQFSKKNLAIIALVIILAASNVAFAVLYMTKNLNITGGVATMGAIMVYSDDGITPLTDFDFPLATPGVGLSYTLHFFINNTGNSPVYVYYNISSSSIGWTPDSYGYTHQEGGYTKYYLRPLIWYPAYGDYWSPREILPPESVFLNTGYGREVELEYMYSGIPNTAETFSFVFTFYAENA